MTSKLIRCFIDGFTLGIKSPSIAYLVRGSEHVHWFSNLEGEMHSIYGFVDKQPSRMQGQCFLEVGWGGQQFSIKIIKNKIKMI